MAAVEIRDRDTGWAQVIRELRQMDGLTLEVGIFDPDIAWYAEKWEVHDGFLRDTWDRYEPGLTALFERVLSITPSADALEAALLAYGSTIAAATSQRIQDIPRVKTGAMRDSITALVSRGR